MKRTKNMDTIDTLRADVEVPCPLKNYDALKDAIEKAALRYFDNYEFDFEDVHYDRYQTKQFSIKLSHHFNPTNNYLLDKIESVSYSLTIYVHWNHRSQTAEDLDRALKQAKDTLTGRAIMITESLIRKISIREKHGISSQKP